MRATVFSLLALTVISGTALAQPAVGGKAAAKAAPAAKPGAAAPAAGTKKFGDFLVRCAQAKSVAPCDLYEERGDKNTGQRLIGFSIGYVPSAGRYILQVAVPLGVDLAKGATISDGKNSTPVLPYRRCDQAGCYVEAAVDKSFLDLLAKMASTAKITVTSYNGAGNGKVYPFSFSFDGFGEALNDMVAENKAKASSPDTATDAR
ncbi:MAG: invasion associated locus B family protein [Alphaproteobacteria bacterium]|nr:invasion associated locus B family protein [Alphaproteobacteria bacterium]